MSVFELMKFLIDTDKEDREIWKAAFHAWHSLHVKQWRAERNVGAWSGPRLEAIVYNLHNSQFANRFYTWSTIHSTSRSIHKIGLILFFWYGLTISVRLKMKKFWTAKKKKIAEKKNPRVMGHFFHCVFFLLRRGKKTSMNRRGSRINFFQHLHLIRSHVSFFRCGFLSLVTQ